MLAKQFLLNFDGSYPNGVTEQHIISLGLIPVIPTNPPSVIPVNCYVQEDDPIMKNGRYVQQWKIVEYTEAEIERMKMLQHVDMLTIDAKEI